jgi:peptidoglycan L-alanyl-D-glutamate endopeptidase CwlK
MPKFGNSSKRRRETLHPKLRKLVDELIKHRDFTIVDGWRGMKRQNELESEGKSTVCWPDSKHNTMVDDHGRFIELIPGAAPIVGQNAHPCAIAVDIAPYIGGRIRWEEKQVILLVGYALRLADELGIKVRWGLDWDGDRDIMETNFRDAYHIELLEY